MAKRALRENEIRVRVRGAGSKGRALEYIRPLAGKTVSEAIDILDGPEGPQTGLPVGILAPYYLNRTEVQGTSGIVLKGGDLLSVDDP